jgi:hypothetical protein
MIDTSLLNALSRIIKIFTLLEGISEYLKYLSTHTQKLWGNSSEENSYRPNITATLV